MEHQRIINLNQKAAGMTTQRKRRPASHDAERIITQAELARFAKLKAGYQEFEEARRQLRERVLKGVPVEPGHFRYPSGLMRAPGPHA